MKLTEKNLMESIKNAKSTGTINRSIKKNISFFNMIKEKTKFLTENVSLTERIFNIKNDFNDEQKCFCGEKLSWNKKRYYNKTCGDPNCISKLKCDLTDEQKQEKNRKANQTRLERYGDSKYINVGKIKETNLRKYGETSYTKTKEYKEMMLEKHGYVSPFELEETHKKSKQTLNERYGVDHNFKISGMTEKIQETWIKNFGEKHTMKHKVFVDKLIETNNKKYGFNSPLMNETIKEKSKQTLKMNYGVDSPLKSEKIRDRFIKTCMLKYGETHYMKNSTFYDNFFKKYHKSFSYKIYEVNNEKYYLQGYEDLVLEKLLEINDIENILISNSDITKEIGKIEYLGEDGKKHKYYPDFYIKDTNKIIEVKSDFTYEIELSKNLLKEKACKDKGLNFDFVIISKNEYNEWKKK